MSKAAQHTSSFVRTPLPPFAVDERRACFGKDPNLFFPERGSNTLPAKTICRSCPFVDECLAYALPLVDLHGVWGATTTDERITMRIRAEQKARGER